MNPWPDLRPILTGLDWAIVGAVATRVYMPERATKDLDILVSQQDGEAAIQKLEGAGYRPLTALSIPGFTLVSPDGVEVDILFGSQPWLAEALAHPRLDPAGYPALDLPYLVLLKIEASRTQDLSDLSRMLGLASATELDQVRAIVQRYAPDTLDDIESLIYLGQMELKIPPQPPGAEGSGL